MYKLNFKGFKKKLFSGMLATSVVASGMFIPTMSSAEVLHPTGLIMTDEIPYSVTAAPALTTYNLPSTCDLTMLFPSVGNQQSQGSCVAFAAGYAALTYQKAHDRMYNGEAGYLDNDSNIFSPAYIYNQVHVDDSATGGGAFYSEVFNLLKTQGCTTLADMPYNGSAYNYTTQPTASQIANASKNKIFSWQYLPAGNVNQIKATLNKLNPVVVGIPVLPDFDTLSSSNPIFDNAAGSSRGGHALCIVGYDDSKQAVKIINSWGTGWGLNGYGWISYDLIEDLNLQTYSFPVSPWNFKCVNSGGLGCEFAWNHVGDSKYAIYRKPTGSAEEPTKVLDSGTDRRVFLDTLFGSYDYYCTIVDDNGNRLSGFSNSVTITKYRSGPSFFKITNRSGTLVQFRWSYEAGAKYAIYRRQIGSTEEPIKVKDVGLSNMTSLTVPIGNYEYCVAYVDASGNRISWYSQFCPVIF